MEILIRRAEPGDYEEIARTFQDESAYSGTLQLPFPSADLWRKRLAETSDAEFTLVALVDGRMAGNGGLHLAARSPRRAHAMALGMAVHSQFQGMGAGSALMKALVDLADGWLNVFRLELTVYTDNDRALALYRKFGFEIEGTCKAYALRDGRYVDAHIMARLKPKSVTVG